MLFHRKHSTSFNTARHDLLKRPQLARWFLLLGQLMSVGFSLKQAVGFTTRVMPKERRQFSVIADSLQAGHSFATAVKPFVGVDLQAQLLLAECHGNLGETLSEIGSYLQMQQKQRKKLMVLLQYPLMLLIMLLMMLVALKIFVFPELQSWQNNGNFEWWQLVPWKLLAVVSITILVVAVSCWLCRWKKQDANGRAQLLSRLPVLGKMFRLYYGYYLISNLAVMLTHGLSLQECCQVVMKLDRRSLLCWWGTTIARLEMNGDDLFKQLKKTSYLPRELPLFLERGLTVKQLAAELTAYHHLLFQQLLTKTEQLLVFVQPVLFIVVAVMIVGMYLSILLPIYHSLQGVY